MRKRVFTLVSIILATILITAAAWAIKSGKFAGLADVIANDKGVVVVVKDAQGNPAPNISIGVCSSTDGQSYSCSGLGATDSSGKYKHLYHQGDPTFHSFKYSVNAINLCPEPKESNPILWSVFSSTLTTINFKLNTCNTSGKGGISGKVTDNNKAVSDADVGLYDSSGKHTGVLVSTRSDGTYSMSNLDPANYTVKAWTGQGSSYKEGQAQTQVKANETTSNVNIVLKAKTAPTPTPSETTTPSTPPDAETFSLVAEILDKDSGGKIAGAKVEVTPEQKPESGSSAESQDKAIDASKYDESNVKVDNIYFPGWNFCLNTTYNYKLKITHPDYQTYETTFWCKGHVIGYSGERLYKAGKIFLEQEIATIYGVAIDKDTKQSIFQASVHLMIGGKTLLDSDGGPIVAITDREGHYEFSELEPGHYTVYIFHRKYLDYGQIFKEVDVLDNKKSEVNFELEKTTEVKTFKLSVKILDENNQAVSLEDLEEEGGMYVANSENLNIPLWGNYTVEYDEAGDPLHLFFTEIPCGQGLTLIVRFTGFYYEENGRSYRIKTIFKDLSGSQRTCARDNSNYEVTVKLEKDYSLVNNKDKPDLRGTLSILDHYDDSYVPDDSEAEKKGCAMMYPLHYRQSREKVMVVLTTIDNPGNKISKMAEEDGSFEFIDLEPGKYKISIQADCYQTEEKIVEVRDIDVEDENLFLKYKEECQSHFSSIDIGGVKFYFLGPDSQQYINNPVWQKVAYVLKDLESKIKINGKSIGIPPIYIVDSSFPNGMFDPICSLRGEDFVSIRVTTALLLSPDLFTNLEDLFVHEYGHYAHSKLFGTSIKITNNLVYEQWNNLYEAAMEEEGCVMSAISDFLLWQVNHELGGHPWDSPDEFFASYFGAYFKHHTRLKAMLIGDKSLPESECKNVLKFAWNFFAEKVANEPSERIESLGASMNTGIILFSDDKEIFGPIVGGKIGNVVYTPEQIRKGLWKQSVYDKLPVGQKIKVQLTRTLSNIYRLMNINPDRLRTKIGIYVAQFNNLIDRLLPFAAKGNVEGKVMAKIAPQASYQPSANVIVIIGKKMAVTDNEGKFKVEGIGKGNREIEVLDGKTLEKFKVSPETITIEKDKTLKKNLYIK